VNEWSGVFLAVMAASLAIMAAIQVGLIVVGLRVAKQMSAATTKLHEEIQPLIQKANVIADDASRITALAALQVERVDQFMTTTTTRLDNTMNIIQNVMAGPVGRGAAAVSAFRAVMGAVRDWKGGRRRRQTHDDHDDVWFVG
jgi:hypothetical protein